MDTNSVSTNGVKKEKKSLKDLKDIKSFDDFNLEDYDLVRGETPEGIEEKCLQLCKEYLSGVWTQQTVDTISFRRISGGMTNQLYYCGLKADTDVSDSDVKEVAIRMYGPKWFNNLDANGNVMKNERLTDLIIALTVSENKLGPKIYGLFENGQIQEFIEHRQFRVPEQNDPQLSAELFKKLARVQAMDVPIKRTNNWLFEFFDDFYNKGVKNGSFNLCEKLKLEALNAQNLQTEIQWLKKSIESIGSPVVFSHNDFRGSNIMVSKDKHNTKEGITLCDFEYSCYTYRGFDLGTIFGEWGRGLNDFAKPHDFPEDSVVETLIRHYIDESVAIFGPKYAENKINSTQQLLKEVKLFSLVANIFMVLFGLIDHDESNGMPMDKKLILGFGDISFKNYMQLKNRFLAQNAF